MKSFLCALSFGLLACQPRVPPLCAAAELCLSASGRPLAVHFSADRQWAEVLHPPRRLRLEAVKGGYRSRDGRFYLQYDGRGWRWREREPLGSASPAPF